MKPGDKPIVNPVVVLREEFDDWAVLFNPDTADAVGVNPVGVTVWKHLDGDHDLAALVTAVRASFTEVASDVEDDVTQFVDQLLDGGFAGHEWPKEQ